MRSLVKKLGFLLVAISWLPMAFLPSQSKAAASFATCVQQDQSDAAITVESARSVAQFHEFRTGNFQSWLGRSVGAETLRLAEAGIPALPSARDYSRNASALPRLHSGWQFALRAAPNPRAPTLS